MPVESFFDRCVCRCFVFSSKGSTFGRGTVKEENDCTSRSQLSRNLPHIPLNELDSSMGPDWARSSSIHKHLKKHAHIPHGQKHTRRFKKTPSTTFKKNNYTKLLKKPGGNNPHKSKLSTPAEAMVVKPNITPNCASMKSPQTIMILGAFAKKGGKRAEDD